MVDPTMKKAGQEGFTIIELLVVIFILLLMAMFAIPSILDIIYKSKIQSTNRLSVSLAQNARYRAIKRRIPAGIHVDSDTNTVTAFLDIDGDEAYTPGADELIDLFEFPNYIGYDSPAGPVFDGMKDSGGTEHWVIFDPDGSLDPVGAYRYGDRGNFFEVRFGPAATGKIQVRKYNSDAVNYDGTHWWGNAEGEPWEWNY